MFKTQVEPQAAGEWFHCKDLNILWRHFYGNCGRFVSYNNIYFITKNQKQNNRHCVTCYVISMVYTLDQSAREDSLSYCKIKNIHHALIITVTQPVSTLLQGGG